MSTIGSFEGFQAVSLKQEGDDQPSETDHLSMEEEDPMPRQISRQSSVTESTLYPNPYHQPYISRKYFATRPGAIETAMEDLKGHVAETSGETIQGFWLLTNTPRQGKAKTTTMRTQKQKSQLPQQQPQNKKTKENKQTCRPRKNGSIKPAPRRTS